MRDLEYFNKAPVGGGTEIAEQMLSIETLSWLLTVSQAAKNVGTLHLNPIHADTHGSCRVGQADRGALPRPPHRSHLASTAPTT